MKYPYDETYVPPAIFLPVEVIHPMYAAQKQFGRAKIDTAADLTVIPFQLAQKLKLHEANRYVVAGYDGREATLVSYLISLKLGDLTLEGLDVLTFQEDYVLLGRDVLNQLRLLLDGPGLFLEVLT